ncbi:MAG: SDR family oxidoreductase [Saprospiraceae bacterium]|nr:SDR family oxidoreductase [Saprospiraceae bacterium]
MDTIVVFGSNGGIGKAICNQLKEKQYHVVGSDISKVSEHENVSEYYCLDLRANENILKVSQQIMQKNSKIWGLVFSAGVYPVIDFSNYSLEIFSEVLQINLTSAFLICKSFSDHFQSGGRIVLITSGATEVGSQDIGYSVSKAGLSGLAKGMAKSFGNKILVNVVSPGIIETPMSANMATERKNKTIEQTTSKRIGTPHEVAVSVLFLLNKENTYMSGATIDVNGGLYFR